MAFYLLIPPKTAPPVMAFARLGDSFLFAGLNNGNDYRLGCGFIFYLMFCPLIL